MPNGHGFVTSIQHIKELCINYYPNFYQIIVEQFGSCTWQQAQTIGSAAEVAEVGPEHQGVRLGEGDGSDDEDVEQEDEAFVEVLLAVEAPFLTKVRPDVAHQLQKPI